jgi:hypothetical protein
MYSQLEVLNNVLRKDVETVTRGQLWSRAYTISCTKELSMVESWTTGAAHPVKGLPKPISCKFRDVTSSEYSSDFRATLGKQCSKRLRKNVNSITKAFRFGTGNRK